MRYIKKILSSPIKHLYTFYHNTLERDIANDPIIIIIILKSSADDLIDYRLAMIGDKLQRRLNFFVVFTLRQSNPKPNIWIIVSRLIFINIIIIKA